MASPPTAADLDVVRRINVFRGLKPGIIEELIVPATVLALREGETLFHQGDPAAAFPRHPLHQDDAGHRAGNARLDVAPFAPSDAADRAAQGQVRFQRVAAFLAPLCSVEQGSCTIALSYDKSLIAGRLGLVPESLSRAFISLSRSASSFARLTSW